MITPTRTMIYARFFWLEQIHEQVAAAFAAAQTQDLRGNRGTDVGTEG